MRFRCRAQATVRWDRNFEKKRKTENQKNRKAEKQKSRKTEKQKNRKTEKQGAVKKA